MKEKRIRAIYLLNKQKLRLVFRDYKQQKVFFYKSINSKIPINFLNTIIFNKQLNL